jgi:hypothetical protein
LREEISWNSSGFAEVAGIGLELYFKARGGTYVFR